MELILENIKRIWTSEEAIFIETTNGAIGKELFSNYPRLRNASHSERENYTTSVYGLHWENLDEDLSFEGFFKKKVKKSELGELLSRFDILNISAFARRLGISQPLMAAYISGYKKPGKARRREIIRELHRIGKELQKAKL